MDELFSRVWTNLVGRVTGPMQFRLVVQPLMATILAIRSGLRDAREGNPPFIWALAFSPGNRRDLLRHAWKDIGKVFIVAVILDAVYQIFVLHTFYPGEAIIVAMLLALVPYLLVRAPVTRLARRKKARHERRVNA